MAQPPMSGGPAVSPGSGEPPRPTPSRARPVVLLVALLGLVGLGVWYAVMRGQQPPVLPSAPPPVIAQADAGAAPLAPPPSVQEGDARVRELVGPLSSEPELAKWLGVEGLLQRFTTAVSNIADGESPRMVLSFLAPVGGFQVAETQGKSTIDPRSYERYEPVARVMGSLDVQGSARAWRELKPLVDRVYVEIAPPGRTFEQTFAQAIQHLLDVPVPSGDVEVAPRGALYVYTDPQLEGLSRAQKHLVRMGPKNMQVIQGRLRELQSALGLPPVAGR